MKEEQLQSEIDRYKLRYQKIKLQCNQVLKKNKLVSDNRTDNAVKLATDILRILNF